MTFPARYLYHFPFLIFFFFVVAGQEVIPDDWSPKSDDEKFPSVGRARYFQEMRIMTCPACGRIGNRTGSAATARATQHQPERARRRKREHEVAEQESPPPTMHDPNYRLIIARLENMSHHLDEVVRQQRRAHKILVRLVSCTLVFICFSFIVPPFLRPSHA